MDLSYFTRDGDLLVPTPLSTSSWSSKQLHGLAISGALARGTEQTQVALGREDLRAARVIVDLFAPAGSVPSSVETNVAREGRRIVMIDARLLQDGVAVARSSTIFLKPSETPPGAVWSPDPPYAVAPATDLVPVSEEARVPFMKSDREWSQNFGEHQNAHRHQMWQSPIEVVAGEPLTPFVHVAAAADATSMVVNWGEAGVDFINTDVTLSLSRYPVSTEVGFAAIDRVVHDGIAVGTATVFDREGPIGTSMVTSLANARRGISFEKTSYDESGQQIS